MEKDTMEINIPVSKEIYSKLSDICKSLGIKIDDLVKLAFNELFDLILSEPSIFLEKIGIFEDIKEIINRK